ncbi:Os06g0115550, partial [Oryza sativa Japonica Group]
QVAILSLLLFLLSLGRPLLPGTDVALVHPLHAQLGVGLECLHVIRDLHDLNRALLATGDRHVVTLDLGGCGKLLRSRFPHLDLAGTSWEDDKLGLVGLQPLDIGLQTFK